MGGIKTLFRRLRTILWTALTLVTLLAAVLVGIGKLIMPYSVQYKPQLEAWLSDEFRQPVQIESFSGEWKAFGPRISLEGLKLAGQGPDLGLIAIQHAALDIKPLNALIAGRPLYTFHIIGADLALVRTLDGRFEVSGFGVSGRGGDGGSGLNNLARVGELRLEEASVSYDDEQAGIHMQLVDVNGVLQMQGTQLAMEVKASVSDRRRFRVLGDLGATIIVRLDEARRLAAAEWHVQTGELMISEVGSQLPQHELKPRSGWLNAEVWGSWAPGQPQVMEGVLDLRDAQLDEPARVPRLKHLNSRFQWRWHGRRTWRMELADVEIDAGGEKWRSELVSIERNIPGGIGMWVSADYMRVDFPLRLTQRVMASFNARWPRSVPQAASGEVRDFHIIMDSDKQLTSFGGWFGDMNITEWGRYPKLAGFEAEAQLAFGEGEIRFRGKDVRIDWPANFRAPAVVDIPACIMEFLWQGRGQDWQIDARDCEVRNPAISLRGRTRVKSNEGKPALDVNVVIERARLEAFDDYWPGSIMKPGITAWLQRGLVAGEVAEGRLLLSGDMDEWPFRGGEGTLEARIEVLGAELDYHPDWPRATGVRAAARFSGTRMEVIGSVDSIGGAPIRTVKATIEDLQQPVLSLEYDTAATLPEMLGFIQHSPMLADSRLDLGAYTFRGPAETTGSLRVPLGSSGGAMAVDGVLNLQGTGFQVVEASQHIESISGAIHYDQAGFRGTGLQALYEGAPGTLDLQADWDAVQLFHARLQGRYPVATILGQADLGQDPMLGRITGESGWVADLSVVDSPDSAEHEIWLEMASGLEGVSMDLPAPLAKPPEENWPLVLRYPIQSADPRFTAEIEGRLAIEVETEKGLSGPVRAALQLGGGAVSLPPAGYFSLAGSVPLLDLDSWMDLIVTYVEKERYPGGLKFRNAALHSAELLLLDRRFTDVDVGVELDDSIMRAVFDGPEIGGTVRYNRATEGAHSLAAELERLFLPAPLHEGVTMDTNPAQLPELHVYVRDFHYLDMDLGEMRIEAFPLGNGLRIDSVEAVSPSVNFQARGDWTVDAGGHRSDFDLVVTSESLGSLVQAMNLSSVLEGGQTVLRYDAWWPGPPAAFALAAVNGEMQFNIVDGRILNADPGAGRVLGLLSVAALPRRLALDFRDVFESGFSFDRARGTVILENGTARTDDFVMESTAASLSIAGSSDLVAKNFDYRLTVRPGVSQALPMLGAIAAGPGGAAAGLALQRLFRDALGDATEARYAISGPWSEPQVERLPDVVPTKPVTPQPDENGQSNE